MSPKTALLFEDNAFYREVMTEVLQEKNFQVRAYSNPTLFLAQKDPCCGADDRCCADVLISDNHMPGMSGLEFLEYAHASGCRLPRSKAVISGNWTEEDHARASRLGCKIFQKPTSIDELFAWLDDVIHAQRP